MGYTGNFIFVSMVLLVLFSTVNWDEWDGTDRNVLETQADEGAEDVDKTNTEAYCEDPDFNVRPILFSHKFQYIFFLTTGSNHCFFVQDGL